MRHTAAVLVVLLAVTSRGARAEEVTPSIAIRNVTVIDVTGGPPQPASTVVVTGNRISAVGPTTAVEVPAGARVVGGEGKFLIPGLWDAHVHWHLPDSLPLFTANGVTGIRLMWGEPKHRRWAREIADGKRVGPRLSMAGAILDGPEPIWSFARAVKSESDGRKAVAETRAMGADFVKVYSRLPREIFVAIADEARKLGIPFAGHVPDAVNAGEASDLGQRSIEHLTGLLMASSSREQELRMQAAQATATDMAARGRVARAALESFDPARAEALFERFRANGTWQVPTLVIQRNLAQLEDEAIRHDPRMKYLPQSIRKSWNPSADIRTRERKADDVAWGRRLYAAAKDLVGRMSRAGVGIAAGTDVFTLYVMPGFSLHDELALLVEAGLNPLQALRAATLDAARLVGRQDELGAIETGKLADMVLLDADPLADIRNTTRIDAVISNGRLFDRAALDGMLAEAERAARR